MNFPNYYGDEFMFTLFDQPFKINHEFDSKDGFSALMLSSFNIPEHQSVILYNGFFDNKKIFTYHDIDSYFDNTDDYHKFLANPLIMEAS